MAASIMTNLPMQWSLLIGMPGFAELQTAIVQGALISMRQVLSHHTTTACQPGKLAGPATSLKKGGFDARLGEEGAWFVNVQLAHSYEDGDKFWVIYTSAPHKKFQAAQHQAATDLLTLLLANRPQAVHIHPNTMRDIESVRDCATRVHQAALEAPGVSAAASGWVDMPARDRTVPNPRPRRGGARAVVDAEAVQAVRIVLQTLVVGREYSPGNLPARVWQTFANELPKGSLRRTLEEMPDIVEVSV